jgi:hypothetical protein
MKEEGEVTEKQFKGKCDLKRVKKLKKDILKLYYSNNCSDHIPILP